jgi:hypothetical protein
MSENTTRIVGTFKCPNGHVFETVQKPIMVTTCQEPYCGAGAHRQATHFEPSPLVSTALVRLALSRAAEWLANPPPAGVKAAVDAGALVKELHDVLGQVFDVAMGVALEHHATVADALATLETPPTPADSLAKLRAGGWMVACHNDYRQGGRRHTYWSFARGSQYVKGEGATDTEALAACTAAAAQLPDATEGR